MRTRRRGVARLKAEAQRHVRQYPTTMSLTASNIRTFAFGVWGAEYQEEPTCLRGALPPVLLRAVCFVLAMVS